MTLAKNYALLFSGGECTSLHCLSMQGPARVADTDMLALVLNRRAGFGDSDSMWSTFYELSAQGICDSMTDPAQKEYFTSDYKQGFKDAWKWLQSRDRGAPSSQLQSSARAVESCISDLIKPVTEALLKHAKASVLPLNPVLAKTPFLSGHQPGFVDFIAYGRCASLFRACM